MNRKIVLLAFASVLSLSLVAGTSSIIMSPLPVHNIDTGLDYAKIQEAIDAPETLDGHTIIVDAGTYYESVNITKSLRVIGQDESTTIVDAQHSPVTDPVLFTNNDNVTVMRLTVQNAQMAGIWVSYCDGFTISSITVKDCSVAGIFFEDSGNGKVSGNTVIGSFYGLDVEDTNDTIITGNKVSRCAAAIGFFGARRITLRENELYDNDLSIFFGSVGYEEVHHYIHDIDISNTVDGKQVYYMTNQKNRVITGADVGFVALVNCQNMTVKDLNFTNNQYGILLVNTTDSIIRSNLFHENKWDGISLKYNSSNNEIYENTLWLNKDGMYIDITCGGNRIYHNLFLNSTRLQVDIPAPSRENFWDNGYPIGGNFWSDYSDVDLCSGPHQNETGGDGIWDHAYVINNNNTDNYPLVNPPGTTSTFDVVWEDTTYPVMVFCDGWVQVFSFNQSSKMISFQVSEGSFVDITVPKVLLDGAMNVSVNGKAVASILTWDDTHIFVSLDLDSTDEVIVKIVAEIVTEIPIIIFPDIDGNGEVNIVDVSIVARHFGEKR